jgi:hypothetical protein
VNRFFPMILIMALLVGAICTRFNAPRPSMHPNPQWGYGGLNSKLPDGRWHDGVYRGAGKRIARIS